MLATVAAASFLATIVPATVLFCSALPAPSGTSHQGTGLAEGDPDGIEIAGLIGPHTPAQVAGAVARRQDGVRRVYLDSVGGQVVAMRQVVRVIAPLHAQVIVPDGATCQSACVGILAAADTVKIASDATLMFHADVSQIGPSNAGICGCINRAAALLSLAYRKWRGRQPVMLSWARQLSGRLPELFAACPVNPLGTLEGITLSGAQFNGLRDGLLTPKDLVQRCPASHGRQ